MSTAGRDDALPGPRGLGLLALACFAAIALPLVALVLRAPWGRLADLVADPAVLAAVRLSLLAPALATVVVAALGTPLAWVLARRRLPAHRLVRAVVLVPMVLPPVVGGVALLLAFGRRGLVGTVLERAAGIQVPFTTAAVVLAAVFVALPFFVVSAEAGFAAVDRHQELAAATFGAGPWRVLWRVTLPAARPALAAGAAVAWARALGEFGATITFAGNLEGVTQTMPLATYVLLQRDQDAAVAVALLLLALSIGILVTLRGHWLPGAVGARRTGADRAADAERADRAAGATDDPAAGATHVAATAGTDGPAPGEPTREAAERHAQATSWHGDATLGAPAVHPAPPTAIVEVVVDRPGFRLDVSLRLRPEVTVLVGPNGAGKSTLLAALAGTLPVSRRRGTITVGSRVLDHGDDHVAPHDRRVGMLFQQPSLFAHVDVLDNVASAHARMRRVRPADRDAASTALDRVAVPRTTWHRRPDALSGGQAQRVALARTLAAEPDLVLLDEPLAAVDAAGRARLRTLLRDRLRAQGVPAVVVSHDLADIAALADRVVVLEDGTVTGDGTVAELATAPPSPFVARLLGSNLLAGTADGTDVVVPADGAGDATRAPVHLTTATPAVGPVHVSFSPRAVALFTTPPAGSPRNVLAGTVARIDDLGDRLHVHVRAGLPVVAEITPAAARDLHLQVGSSVHAAVKATEIAVHGPTRSVTRNA